MRASACAHMHGNGRSTTHPEAKLAHMHENGHSTTHPEAKLAHMHASCCGNQPAVLMCSANSATRSASTGPIMTASLWPAVGSTTVWVTRSARATCALSSGGMASSAWLYITATRSEERRAGRDGEVKCKRTEEFR